MKTKFPLLLAVLIYFYIEVLFPKGLPAISLGNISVYVLDLVALLCVLAIIVKFFRQNLKINKAILPLLFLGLLLLTSMLRGIQLFGLEPAVNSMRGYLYFYVMALSVLVLGWSEISISKLIFTWGLIAWLIFGIVLVKWILVAMGFIQNPNWVSAGGGMMRVINASQTLFLVQAVIFALFIPKEEKLIPFQRTMPWVLIPTIILLQHRTVWVVLLFVIILFVMNNKKAIALTPLVLSSFIILSVGVYFLIENSQLINSLTGSAINMQTFAWRLEGWKQLINQSRGDSFINHLIGQPFGTGYTRNLFDSSYTVTVSPHNFYIQTFLDIGIIGLLLPIIIYVKSLLHLKHRNFTFSSRTFLVLLISQLIYFLPYSPGYEQGLLLGSAILISKAAKENGIDK